MSERFASAIELVNEYADLEKQMADPGIHADANNARKLGRRYAQLGPVVAGYRKWKQSVDDLAAAKELADVDPDFAAESRASAPSLATVLLKSFRLRKTESSSALSSRNLCCASIA